MPTILRITSKRAGFRRAGIAHPATPTDHRMDAFSATQLRQLYAEPMLEIEKIEQAPKPAKKAPVRKKTAKKAPAKKAAANQ
jgi:hypothetical protein